MSDNVFTFQKAFLGRGWSFPISLDSGKVSMAEFELDVQQSILIILSTDRGERVMRPEFGAGLNDFVFGSINATTCERIRFRVEEALIDWEPRIDVLNVSVEKTKQNNQLDIEVHYRIRATNTEHNLVYPFYLYEGKTP